MADQVQVNPPTLAVPQVPYGPGNPHPLYGKDPNIMNEFGHTHYPKWVNGVLVKSEKEEKALAKVENKDWDK